MNADDSHTLLRESILKTLALFAAQDQAVTLLELQRLLLRTSPGQTWPSLSILQGVLEQDLQGRVTALHGLYALSSHAEAIKLRTQKYLKTSELFKKARRWISPLRHFPYLRAVAISGSSAQMNAGPGSDIDLFIITDPNRVFTARFFVSAYFQVFGLRRHDQKISGRFCLNHYVAAGHRLAEDHTPYTALLYASLTSVFGRRHIQDFFRHNADWLKEYFLAPYLPYVHVFEHADSPQSAVSKFFTLLLLPISGLLENLLGWLQKQRIRQSQFVVVSEKELAFHPESRGQKILARYNAILEGLGH